jgi:diguanylate cyclase (GGDEF)-like protein
MVDVAECVWTQHNLWLAFLAAVVCALGSFAVVGLFSRAAESIGRQRLGWIFLTAIAAGASIWCTHFIAILAFEPGAPVELDAPLTMLSLLVALAGAAGGIIVALSGYGRAAPSLGGALLGLSIAAMHYTGMLAYRVQGFVEWRQGYVVASVAMAVAFSALATEALTGPWARRRRLAGGSALVIAIVSLHFTGMTAFRVKALLIDHAVTNGEATQILALAVAGMALVIFATGAVSFLIDTSVRDEAYRKLRNMAMRDSLTGLPNRATLHDQLEREIVATDAWGEPFALIAIDLDRFSEINDLNGHGVGDAALQIIARRIESFSREGAFVARLGGDEFEVIYRAGSQRGLREFLARVRAKLLDPIRIGEAEFSVGASMGVAMYPNGGDDKEALISNADLALYKAKAHPLDKICFYQDAMGDAVRARRKLTAELRDAIDRSQLELHYQVQKSVSTGDIVGYEALLRWNHPEHGRVPPADFIPIAENSGQIVPIGAWVLREACAQAAEWPSPYTIAVNLSPFQFSQPNLPKIVDDILRETGLAPARLELELTESAIIAGKQRTLDTLSRIKALGVSIALDDFGAGYSSLETLRAFPFDKIKLDRLFMSGVETSESAKAILRAVLALGRSLGIPVLAEGIETEGQWAMLKREGCMEAQGYYLGRPAPMHQHLADLARRPASQPISLAS